MTNLSVVTNALLIAVTSQFIDRELFNRVYKDDPEYNTGNGSFARWATSEFPFTNLLRSVDDDGSTTFPVFTAQQLYEYNDNGDIVSLVAHLYSYCCTVLHFLIHINILMLYRKFELILT